MSSKRSSKKVGFLITASILALLILAACAPQEVEVTRVVQQVVEQEVEVTRIVEQEVEVEVPVEVEVTRIVEVTPEVIL